MLSCPFSSDHQLANVNLLQLNLSISLIISSSASFLILTLLPMLQCQLHSLPTQPSWPACTVNMLNHLSTNMWFACYTHAELNVQYTFRATVFAFLQTITQGCPWVRVISYTTDSLKGKSPRDEELSWAVLTWGARVQQTSAWGAIWCQTCGHNKAIVAEVRELLV